jgi:hypothetical protein
LEKKPGRSCKGADSSRLSSKVSWTLFWAYIVGQDPSDSKSNRFTCWHLPVLLPFISWGILFHRFFLNDRQSSRSFQLQPVIFQTQLFHQ